MSLPWVRLDSNIASHDKVLRLLSQKDGFRAVAIMMFAFGWSGAHGTDGHIPAVALPLIHATDKHAAMLVEVGAWEPAEDGGWLIHNWAERQELDVISEAKRAAARIRARKANCIRWHGPDCGCWKAGRDDA